MHEIGIFGSFARNEKNDVDFLVDFYREKKTYNNFIHLAYFLEDLGGRKVELVTKKD